ncbi:hypothetical protein QBC47DRAFT_401500 [Echria macrotheca]|uniref:CBM-cenC domain-containing protein n=1 Tax=Echria macrotheca TaxID=438768 RepID=A0AAJ0BE60_9PEZI|nr:hypothetical protein QBC47DRAFT_401500 [Echria macrotheca]
MKGILFLTSGVLAGLATAECTARCGTRQCRDALIADREIGEAFCSAFLSLEPATTTATEAMTETTTVASTETSVTTLTVTTSTVTTTEGSPTTIFQKRTQTASPVLPSDVIVEKCGPTDEKISRACSCILSSATTPTITVVESTTATTTVEDLSTETSTVTSDVVATTAVAPPAVTIPPNVVTNGNFENYVQTGNILPWTIDTTSGGSIQIIDGVNPCTTGGAYCAGGRIVIRAFPPTSGSTKQVGIEQTVVARPSTTYNFSFMYRCLNFDTNSKITIVYNNAVVGTALCPPGSSSAFNLAQGFQFTTDEQGTGDLQVWFANPSGLQSLYYYADDFKAIAASS